ncbi:hypothetical protein NIE88_08940 [Sporolactobacillus shoreicorticis]|uniref:Uncharacterized protein n=1 Tax=Sporolactobacillus shoreicorticis TaxID=1923877 RepID=A0ABW5S2X0_9BACL|nr:hypothetical protein [Sporolactobacillus shoreicorticis]MCO7125897.1 hypothetical protein [Sporolactobacillus shoreicorticis]
MNRRNNPFPPKFQYVGDVPYNTINSSGLRSKLSRIAESAGKSNFIDHINNVRSIIQQASIKKVDKSLIKQTGNNVMNRNKVKIPKADFPQNKPQMRHIFRNAEGHLPDNQTSRQLLQDTANDINCYLGEDKYGNTWYGKLLSDKTQVWVQVRNGIIQNGGVNNPPRKFTTGTGFSKPSNVTKK